MRVCYLTVGGVSLNSGVYQKVFATVKTWRELGHETLLSIGARAGSPAHQDYLKGGNAEPGLFFWNWKAPYLRPVAEFVAARRIMQWRPDVIYVRSWIYTPGMFPLFGKTPIFFEINTNEDAERRAGGALHYAAFRLSAGMMYPHASGFVAVAREIAGLPRYAGRPMEVIANGVRLSDFKVQPVSAETQPTLVMLIGLQFAHHGVDKLLVLAKRFPDWRIILVGAMEIPVEVRACANVEVHPFMPRDQFELVLARAHVAIASLAMHRTGLKEGSVLKTREYLANGLPVILAYEDTDFPDSADFLLQIGNYEKNVADSLDRIEVFVKRWMHRRVDHEQVRNIDMVEKEKKRLEFLRQVAGLPEEHVRDKALSC